jgi:hypothetical protein
VGLSGIAVALLVGCTSLAVVDDHLEAGGSATTEFSADDQAVTLSARFKPYLPAGEPLMVEWLFPDGSVYLRKPVYRSYGSDDGLETSMPIRGKAPARHPGIWHVRLWHDGEKLVNRSFEILEPGQTAASGAQRFASLAYCGPSRWNDPVISGRRSGAVASGSPGAWIGGEVLKTAGATYSGVVLLTGCAPGRSRRGE